MNMLQAFTNRRTVTAEIMDSPGIDERAHLEALEGLRRINRASRTIERMLEPIVQSANSDAITQLSLLDVACGGGDVAVGLALQARQLGIQIDVTFLDRSATALRRAIALAKDAGIISSDVEASALGSAPLPEADIVVSSLFLHHVEHPDQVIALLSAMRRAARRMIVISDLRRSRQGLMTAWIGCRVLSRSAIVHHDGPASVRAAWTPGELSHLASQAGMADAKIECHWPCRMRLVWERHEPS
jgi:2-polyprenyl-3-methyl-5-hydroxy-6-metoxy-1,4-benzoquinol methylase